MTTFSLLKNASEYAFFFDFDGTLTEIARTPEEVIVEERARRALDALYRLTGGAVAPLKLPIAGVHGYERRNIGDVARAGGLDQAAMENAEELLRSFAAYNAGVLLEKKAGALALHYRLRPELETLCIALMEEATAGKDGIVLTRGKMVVEARFHRATKGTAIEAFLAERPFLGRVPFFAGDDRTDEDGFALVNAKGGVSLKVGGGETAAMATIASVDEFLTWLLRLTEPVGGHA